MTIIYNDNDGNDDTNNSFNYKVMLYLQSGISYLPILLCWLCNI